VGADLEAVRQGRHRRGPGRGFVSVGASSDQFVCPDVPSWHLLCILPLGGEKEWHTRSQCGSCCRKAPACPRAKPSRPSGWRVTESTSAIPTRSAWAVLRDSFATII